MKISLSWLKDFVSIAVTPEELADKLTFSGLEVEAITPISTAPQELRSLVVGEVVSCEQHPNADRLKCTRVNIGSPDLLSIVCGAANVAVGQKVVVATVGTTLYPKEGEPLLIKKSKIRGEASEGMLCAEDEIGLSDNHDGIMVLDDSLKPGSLFSDAMGYSQDIVFEIGLTANRGDAASHLGVARDVAALLETVLVIPEYVLPKAEVENNWQIELADEDCIRYTALVLKGVTVKQSPDWLKNRLQSIGLKPINNVVDVTNYVMHDLGQPIHAFDAEKIAGKKVVVKKVAPETVFVTLDKQARKLDGSELMICNAEEPMAIAGVFGGLQSGVSDATQSVFIESATFKPQSIRKTAKKLGLSTDASFRYERGTDVEITVLAIQKVASLLLEIAGAEPDSPIMHCYPNAIQKRVISLPKDFVAKKTGQEIPQDEIQTILLNLGFGLADQSEVAWQVTVPSHKTDIHLPIDLVEEVLRIYGLNRIEIPERTLVPYGKSDKTEKHHSIKKVSKHLVARGFFEIMTNTMVSEGIYAEAENTDAVKLLNPLSSEMAQMRNGLLPSMLQVIAYNKNRKSNDLRLFEFMKSYRRDGENFVETEHLCLAVTGNWQLQSFREKARKADFYDLKNEVNEILAVCGIAAPLKNWSFEVFASTKKADALVHVAPVAKALLERFDIKDNVYYAELQWDKLLPRSNFGKINAMPPPKFPEVKRDLSIILDEAVSFKEITQLVKETDKGLIKSVVVFDVYRGENIGSGKKSYSISFMLQHEEKTLTEEEIDKLMGKLIATFEMKLNAIIRK